MNTKTTLESIQHRLADINDYMREIDEAHHADGDWMETPAYRIAMHIVIRDVIAVLTDAFGETKGSAV